MNAVEDGTEVLSTPSCNSHRSQALGCRARRFQVCQRLLVQVGDLAQISSHAQATSMAENPGQPGLERHLARRCNSDRCQSLPRIFRLLAWEGKRLDHVLQATA